MDACPPGSQTGNALCRFIHGARTKRFCGLTGRSASFLELLVHPLLLAAANHLLLPSCGRYWLNTTQAIGIGPGERAQVIHRDEASWPPLDLTGPEVLVGCIVALTEFTAENGATRIAPGTHGRAGRRVEPSSEGVEPVLLSPGSALLYTGSVLHGGGANFTSDSWRWGIHVSYLLGWLRPEENHFLATPWEVARRLPLRAQELLGYSSYDPGISGGRLGLVDAEDAQSVLARTLEGGPEESSS
jgi:ectoine hydroxylase-related dioxygenase (phytanoyl-CoA dioxygenase family)